MEFASIPPRLLTVNPSPQLDVGGQVSPASHDFDLVSSQNSTENCNPKFRMERETGIEPATNGLEGRDSTTELLPLMGMVEVDGFEPP